MLITNSQTPFLRRESREQIPTLEEVTVLNSTLHVDVREQTDVRWQTDSHLSSLHVRPVDIGPDTDDGHNALGQTIYSIRKGDLRYWGQGNVECGPSLDKYSERYNFFGTYIHTVFSYKLYIETENCQYRGLTLRTFWVISGQKIRFVKHCAAKASKL